MMKIKTLLATAITLAILSGCNIDHHANNNNDTNIDNSIANNNKAKEITIATFNLSFDRNTFEQLVDEMQTTPAEQQQLITGFKAQRLDSVQKEKALKIIQIRNVAAIIQSQRPNVILLAEFNNDGTGKDQSALKGFQKNYLAVGQSLNSIDGGNTLKPIKYPFFESYATNTGLKSGFDLNNDGNIDQGDAWGHGEYHGRYAFALLSQYKIDKKNTRTFQQFKWKDLPYAEMPTITNCHDLKHPIPDGMKCGDNWYTKDEWQALRLSSKNHVDAPIIIPTTHGEETIHILMSHPTPPVFDTVTKKNKMQNRDEIQFWNSYITNGNFIYDDKGQRGGLGENEKFVIVGDLNADPHAGDGYRQTIENLLTHHRVNQAASDGYLTPTSLGAETCYSDGECRQDNPYPTRLTSNFGLQVDHAIPSENIDVIKSGIFWPAVNENGRLLVNDERIGKYGTGKDVSSDHRMVWIKAKL